MVKKKLKICLITPAYYPAVRWGGPVVSVRLLAEELVRQGHSITVFATAFGLPAQAGLEQNQNLEKDLGGVQILYFRFFTLKRWFVSWSLLKEVWRKRKEFDLFHINLVWDPVCWMSGAVLVLSGAKIVFSPRGTVEKQLINRRSWLLKSIVYWLLLKPIFKRAGAFHFTSVREKEEFFKYTKLVKLAAVVSNLFNTEQFSRAAVFSGLKELDLAKGKYILYSGRLNWKKRLELLLEAFREFVPKHPELKLALVGAADKDYLDLLKKKIFDLELKDDVVLDGRVIAGDRKLALFQNAYAFVLPSYSENFGFVVLEALASRVPVIVSMGVGLHELLEKYQAALVFQGVGEEAEKADLLAKLEQVCLEKKRAELISNGLALLNKEFKGDILAGQMIKLYQRALN